MHHILERNKRVVSKQKKLVDTSLSQPSSQSIVTSSQRSKESLTKFLHSISPECKQIMSTISAIEKDLRMRIQMYGQDSSQTFEGLQHFVKTCNDHALHLIKLGEFRVATEILHQCEYLLLSPIGQKYPTFKFQTFNNLAHSHNVQANVRLSLKYLLRSLDYALQIDGVDQPQMTKGQTLVSLVETYLNICNAYSFLGQYESGLEYAEKAIMQSYKMINDLMEILNDQNLTPDDRDFFGEQYHSQVNLHAMSFHTKGQIYEKLKQFEEAIMEYQSGKQIIESNYGVQHKQCVDFINAINAVKLKIKYFQHSNLPQEGGTEQIFQKRMPSLDNQNYTDIQIQPKTQTNNTQSLFMHEQEKMKPIAQQKQKRLRPSSAKLQKDVAEIYYNRQVIPVNQSINHSFQVDTNSQRSAKGASISKAKSRSIRRIAIPGRPYLPITKNFVTVHSPSFSNKSTVTSGVEPKSYSTQRKKLVRKLRNFQNIKHNHTHSHNECQDCHAQIEEIRRLQIEQQKLVNMVVQSQSMTNINNQQLLQPNITPFNNSQSSTMIHQNHQATNLLHQQQQQQQQMQFNHSLQMGNSFQNSMTMQQFPQPYPFYYPYAPPPGYMLPPPPPQYGFYPTFNGYGSGIFLPPMRPHHPTMNNFMNPSASGSHSDNMRSTPEKVEIQVDHSQKNLYPHYQNQDQQRNSANSLQTSSNQFQIVTPEQQRPGVGNNFMPQFYPRMHTDEKSGGHHHQMMGSTYTDMNERDSRFGEDFENELRETKLSQGVHFKSQFANPNLQNTDEKTLYSQRNTNKNKWVDQSAMKKIDKETRQDALEKMKIAAIKIQKYYKRYACQKNFKALLAQRRQKFQFHRQIYAHKQKKKSPKQVLLIASLIIVLEKYQKKHRKQPQMVVFEIYDPNEKRIIFEQQLMLNQLGFDTKSDVNNVEVFNRVKNLLSKLHLTGDPKHDLIDQMQGLLKNLSKEKFKQTIVFIEPQYFSEGLAQIKNIKVDRPPQTRKSSSSSDGKHEQSAQDEEPIDESINDNYSDFSDEKVSPQKNKDLSPPQPQKDIKKTVEPISIPQAPVKQKPLSSKSSSSKSISEKFEEEDIEDEYSNKSSKKLSKSHSHENLQQSLKLEELKPKTIEQKSESSKSSHKSVKSESEDSNFKDSYRDDEPLPKAKPPKVTFIDKKQLEKAVVTIQKQARKYIARKDFENKKKSKVKLCQFVLINNKDSAQVTITEKFKKKNSKVKMVVKNLNKKMKKDSHKIKLMRSQLPQNQEQITDFVKKNIKINWKLGRIVDVELNSERVQVEVQRLLIVRHQDTKSVSDKSSDKDEISQHFVEEEIQDEKYDSDQDKGYSQLDEESEGEKSEGKFDPKNRVLTFQELMALEQNEDSKTTSQQPSFIQTQETKKQEQKKPVSNKKKEYEQKVIKAQAYIRGHLVRKHYQHVLQKEDGYNMIARQSRRLSDGKLYYIFLMSTKLSLIQSTEDPYYLIILREVNNINEIYDLEISLEVAKKIFGRKNSSTAELNRLIMFETNRAEFMKMLECLDMINGDFSLNFKKFREFQVQNETLNMKISYHQPQQQKRKGSESPSSSSSSSSSDEDKKKKHKNQKQVPPKRNLHDTIQEAESRFEASPVVQDRYKQPTVPQVKQQPPVQPPPVQQKKKNKLKPVDKKILALIIVQSHFRKFLAVKRAEKLKIQNFRNKSSDPAKHLKLFKQGIHRCAGLYFMYMLYHDDSKQFVKVTIKEVSKKITIISLKKISMAEFNDDEAEIDDIPDYLKGVFDDNFDDLILDKEGKLRKNWVSLLHEFLDENL